MVFEGGGIAASVCSGVVKKMKKASKTTGAFVWEGYKRNEQDKVSVCVVVWFRSSERQTVVLSFGSDYPVLRVRYV